MQHQQANTRRRAARFAATTPTFSSPARKGAIRSRPHVQYSTDMDEIEYARSTLASGTRTLGPASFIGRDGSHDIRSVANVQKISMLQEIFPDVAVEIMEDVLIAAQFRMDAAASMLSELSRETRKSNSHEDSPERADFAFVEWAAIQQESQSDDRDEWHDVSESRPEMQQWVLVHDDWEVVDSAASSSQEKTRSYADVLSSPASPSAVSLPTLTPVTLSTSLSPLAHKKKTSAVADDEDVYELSIKTFNARKRRSLRKFRG